MKCYDNRPIKQLNNKEKTNWFLILKIIGMIFIFTLIIIVSPLEVIDFLTKYLTNLPWEILNLLK
jgi:hypothetical protein